MTFIALATDYDGTIALRGRVDRETVDALQWLKTRGKRIILVTGRELPELQGLFPELHIFDAVVAENGALLFLPSGGKMRSLAPPPPPELVAALEKRGVAPLSVGKTIVATWEPNETAVLEAIHELGLEWQIVFNKGAVMCLPTGVNKASGLKAALGQLGLSPLNVMGVGDAENDHAFLSMCGASAAVANAVPAVKDAADIRLKADHGAGVRELIDMWVGEGSQGLGVGAERTSIAACADGKDARLPISGAAALIAGKSGAGKSSLATALIERALETDAQVVVLDPEGDYDGLEGLAHIGAPDRPPHVKETLDIIAGDPEESVVLNLLGLPLSDRPAFLVDLLGGIASLRARYGRPHWLFIDEAHHFLPAELEASTSALPQDCPGFVFITVAPEAVAPVALGVVASVIAVGPKAPDVLKAVASHHHVKAPKTKPPGDDEILFWRVDEAEAHILEAATPRHEHERHVRKYAEGSLSEAKSFFFRGAGGKLNLRARNLTAFIDLAAGVDDETWEHHLRAGDYSRWMRDSIGDDELAGEVAEIEKGNAADTRGDVKAAIDRRYTAPATP
jgi:HAD superfamily hydrolase (TIGR01484 family)